MPTQATPINTNSVSVLALGKSVNSPVVPLGAYVNFYISLTNLGAVAASNIVVQEELPEGLVFIGAMPATGIYNVTAGQWSIPLVTAGAVANLTLTAQLISSGTATNVVLLTASMPANANLAGNAAQVAVTGTPVTGLAVQVNECDSQGRVVSPLAGASVTVVGSVGGNTDAQGRWSSTNVAVGTYTVTVTNSGFYPVSHTVTVLTNQMPLELMVLAPQTGPGAPLIFDFSLPQGKYYIPGMPRPVTVSAMVAWRGSPGTVNFNIGGTLVNASLTDLGNGTARATVTVPAPSAIAAASELIATAVNGESLSRSFNVGAYLEPLPGIIASWFTWLANSISWSATTSGAGVPKISYTWKTNYTIYSNSIPGQSLTLSSSLGTSLDLGFTPRDGTFKGVIGANGIGNLEVQLPGAAGVEAFVEGNVGLNGTVKLAFAGLNLPTITPGWGVSLNVKDGLRAPAVSLVPAALPAAAPAITFLQNTWGIKSIINSLKLSATFTEGGALNGVYQNGALGNCFLYTTSVSSSVNAGLELEAAVKLGSFKAKIYGGGQGTLDFNLCPEFAFNSLTFEAYAGFSASAFVFSYDKRFSAQLKFGGNGTSLVPLEMAGAPAGPDFPWKPIGATLAPWGPPNQLARINSRPNDQNGSPTFSTESLVVSNVLDAASPSVYADRTETMVLFTAFDPSQPWYASTQIGALRQTNNGTWSFARVTDDNVPDSNPKVAGVNSNLLFASWERIVGDISGTTNPVQVAGDLEIVAAWFDRQTGTWSAPVQLTTNSVVDRDPLPVVFGSTVGILWIQNEANAWVGDAANGDSLLFSEWVGGEWSPPETLWSGPYGILSFAFVADGGGEGQVVFAVDQDGDLDTINDRELYTAATVGGTWQPAVRRTDDLMEDSMPVLVAPNGNPMCIWSQGGTLVYTPLSLWNPKPVFAQATSANDTPTLDGVTMPGGAAVAYAVQSLDGVDLFSSFYNAAQDTWTLPRQLTSDPDEESSVALAFNGTNLVAAYEKTQLLFSNLDLVVNGETETLTNAPQPGRTDLYLLTHLPGADAGVAAGSLNLSPSNPAPGSGATISAVIENFGDGLLQAIPVAFYDGDPQAGGQLIGSIQYVSSLGGGATQEVSVTWTVPEDNDSHQLFVVLDPNDVLPDRDRSNNTASLLSVLPDLVVDSTANTEAGPTSCTLIAQILNQGVIPTGPFAVSWRLDSPTGTEIASCMVGPLAPGQSVPATASWDTSGLQFPSPYAAVYTVADSSNAVAEFDKSNNTYLQMVGVVASWVPQITGIAVMDDSSVRIQFNAANSVPGNFSIESSASLAPPIAWQTEAGAAITTVSPGVFQAVVTPQGDARFYHVRTVP